MASVLEVWPQAADMLKASATKTHFPIFAKLPEMRAMFLNKKGKIGALQSP
jgi:hypothetical protein